MAGNNPTESLAPTHPHTFCVVSKVRFDEDESQTEATERSRMLRFLFHLTTISGRPREAARTQYRHYCHTSTLTLHKARTTPSGAPVNRESYLDLLT